MIELVEILIINSFYLKMDMFNIIISNPFMI